MSAGMARILGPQRRYFLFDSFEGLPEAMTIDGHKALEWQRNNAIDNCRTEEAFAETAMREAGARDFRIIKGWFMDTLPRYEFGEGIAVLRLDADWYSSTADCLNHLYEKIVPGGAVLIDDYYAWDGCSRAIHDFLSINKLPDRICQFADSLCFIVKTQDLPIIKIDPLCPLDRPQGSV